jgi:hypothetical protein
MALYFLGVFLIIAGLLVTVLFWVPGVVDRRYLKNLLGSRYPVIYFIYLANGPVLMLLGLLLIFRFTP